MGLDRDKGTVVTKTNRLSSTQVNSHLQMQCDDGRNQVGAMRPGALKHRPVRLVRGNGDSAKDVRRKPHFGALIGFSESNPSLLPYSLAPPGKALKIKAQEHVENHVVAIPSLD